MAIPIDAALARRLVAQLPEIERLRDRALLDKTVGCWLEALRTGGWEPEDLDRMPASLRLTDRPFRLAHHVRGVTQMAISAYEMYEGLYAGEALRLDYDVLVCGALLHDVGKPMEFVEQGGTWGWSQSARSYRHPFGGFAVASRWEIPPRVLEIIAYHSTEGEHFPRSPEGVVIHLVDALNFSPLLVGRT